MTAGHCRDQKIRLALEFEVDDTQTDSVLAWSH